MSCAAPLALIGNGFCNDEANTAGCTYDGGDCCGECINTELCTACVCHAEAAPAIDISCKLLVFLNAPLHTFLEFHRMIIQVAVCFRKTTVV